VIIIVKAKTGQIGSKVFRDGEFNLMWTRKGCMNLCEFGMSAICNGGKCGLGGEEMMIMNNTTGINQTINGNQGAVCGCDSNFFNCSSAAFTSVDTPPSPLTSAVILSPSQRSFDVAYSTSLLLLPSYSPASSSPYLLSSLNSSYYGLSIISSIVFLYFLYFLISCIRADRRKYDSPHLKGRTTDGKQKISGKKEKEEEKNESRASRQATKLQKLKQWKSFHEANLNHRGSLLSGAESTNGGSYISYRTYWKDRHMFISLFQHTNQSFQASTYDRLAQISALVLTCLIGCAITSIWMHMDTLYHYVDYLYITLGIITGIVLLPFAIAVQKIYLYVQSVYLTYSITFFLFAFNIFLIWLFTSCLTEPASNIWLSASAVGFGVQLFILQPIWFTFAFIFDKCFCSVSPHQPPKQVELDTKAVARAIDLHETVKKQMGSARFRGEEQGLNDIDWQQSEPLSQQQQPNGDGRIDIDTEEEQRLKDIAVAEVELEERKRVRPGAVEIGDLTNGGSRPLSRSNSANSSPRSHGGQNSNFSTMQSNNPIVGGTLKSKFLTILGGSSSAKNSAPSSGTSTPTGGGMIRLNLRKDPATRLTSMSTEDADRDAQITLLQQRAAMVSRTEPIDTSGGKYKINQTLTREDVEMESIRRQNQQMRMANDPITVAALSSMPGSESEYGTRTLPNNGKTKTLKTGVSSAGSTRKFDMDRKYGEENTTALASLPSSISTVAAAAVGRAGNGGRSGNGGVGVGQSNRLAASSSNRYEPTPSPPPPPPPPTDSMVRNGETYMAGIYHPEYSSSPQGLGGGGGGVEEEEDGDGSDEETNQKNASFDGGRRLSQLQTTAAAAIPRLPDRRSSRSRRRSSASQHPILASSISTTSPNRAASPRSNQQGIAIVEKKSESSVVPASVAAARFAAMMENEEKKTEVNEDEEEEEEQEESNESSDPPVFPVYLYPGMPPVTPSLTPSHPSQPSVSLPAPPTGFSGLSSSSSSSSSLFLSLV